MRRALGDMPATWASAPLPLGVAVEAGSSPLRRRPVAGLAAARVRAYPPGHADWEPGWDPEAELEDILSGAECGPLLEPSRVAVADGRVVAAVLLTDGPGSLVVPPGLLVADVYRDPDEAWRGLGGALLRRALAAAAGHEAAHLLVTDGNPARRLYDALGFERLATFTS
jgi:GNAT superfamily N-acetyltransferase